MCVLYIYMYKRKCRPTNYRFTTDSTLVYNFVCIAKNSRSVYNTEWNVKFIQAFSWELSCHAICVFHSCSVISLHSRRSVRYISLWWAILLRLHFLKTLCTVHAFILFHLFTVLTVLHHNRVCFSNCWHFDHRQSL